MISVLSDQKTKAQKQQIEGKTDQLKGKAEEVIGKVREVAVDIASKGTEEIHKVSHKHD